MWYFGERFSSLAMVMDYRPPQSGRPLSYFAFQGIRAGICRNQNWLRVVSASEVVMWMGGEWCNQGPNSQRFHEIIIIILWKYTLLLNEKLIC